MIQIDKEPNDEIIKNKYKHSKWVPGVKKGHGELTSQKYTDSNKA